MDSRKFTLIFYFASMFCFYSVSSYAGNACYTDLTGADKYGTILSAGFIPPAFQKIYWLAQQGAEDSIYSYNPESGSVEKLFTDFTTKNSFSNLVWSPDGKELLTISNGDIYIFNSVSKEFKQLTLDGPIQGSAPVWVNDSEVVFAAPSDTGRGNSLYLLSIDTGKRKLLFHPNRGIVVARAFTPQNGIFIYSVGTVDHTIYYSASIKERTLTDIKSFASPNVLTEGVFSVTSDGEYGVIAGSKKGDSGNKLFLWNLSSGELKEEFSDSKWNVNTASISSDMSSVLSLSTVQGDEGIENAYERHLLFMKLDRDQKLSCNM